MSDKSTIHGHQKNEERDRPTNEDEIEVTPEMIRAAIKEIGGIELPFRRRKSWRRIFMWLWRWLEELNARHAALEDAERSGFYATLRLI